MIRSLDQAETVQERRRRNGAPGLAKAVRRYLAQHGHPEPERRRRVLAVLANKVVRLSERRAAAS